MRLLVVVAARPNFIKAAPLMAALKGKTETVLVHTGQHYDYAMSQAFFEELRLPKPDVHLDVGSGTRAEQISKTMMAMEPVLQAQQPDAMVVFGDVNATLAASLTAATLGIPIAHIEAGVRSFDAMPEEVNRRLTDHLSRWLFTTSPYEDENLAQENITRGVVCVGNIMADTLLAYRASPNGVIEKFGVTKCNYALLTLHRAGNVDDPEKLTDLLTAFAEINKGIPVIFPLHPRLEKRVGEFGLWHLLEGMMTTKPLGYLASIALQTHARFVLTDSGGVQVETTVLRVPCLTILDSAVWPVTHDVGTNILVGTKPTDIVAEAYRFINGKKIAGKVPELWDGHTAERIVEVLTR